MNFCRYTESLTQIQRMAGNFTSLKMDELTELSRLNAECVNMKEEVTKSFTTLIEEIEDGLTLLLDRLDRIKQNLTAISGPDGTLGDVLQLEPAWLQANALLKSIREMLGPESGEQIPRHETMADNPVTAPNINKARTETPGDSGDVRELINQSRDEAAAAVEKSSVAVKTLKKDNGVNGNNSKKQADAKGTVHKDRLQQKKTPKLTLPGPGIKSPTPLVLDKKMGDAEKKLVEEITKNIEIIKGSKKKA